MRRGFFFFFSLPFFFFPPSPTPFSRLIPATCVFLGVRNSGSKAPATPSGQLVSHQHTPLPMSTHKLMASRTPPHPGGFLNGVKMPVPEARVPGPLGPSWAREPRRGGEAGRGRWRNYFLT